MVLIPVKSQYISLLATVLSGLCELLAFSAALSFTKYLECRSLQRGVPLAYRKHVRKTRFITILSAISFIVIEVVYSLFSDCDRLMAPEIQSCISVDVASRLPRKFAQHREAYIVALNCSNVHRDTFEQRYGNVSLVNLRTVCADQLAFSYNMSADHRSFPTDLATRHCVGNVCSYALVQHSLVYISTKQQRANAQNQANNISFFATNLHEKSAVEPPATYAQRAAAQYADGINDERDLRRRVFLASSETQCSFRVDKGAATQIHPALLAFIIVVWFGSLICYLASIVLRRHIFYDMSNPLHWKKLQAQCGVPCEDDAVVVCSYRDGKRVLNLWEYASDLSEVESYGDMSDESSVPV